MRLTGDTGHLRGALLCLRSKDYLEVKEKEGWGFQCKTNTAEILVVIQNIEEEGERKMKYIKRVKTKKGLNAYPAFDTLKISWHLLFYISIGGRQSILHFCLISSICKLYVQITGKVAKYQEKDGRKLQLMLNFIPAQEARQTWEEFKLGKGDNKILDMHGSSVILHTMAGGSNLFSP